MSNSLITAQNDSEELSYDVVSVPERDLGDVKGRSGRFGNGVVQDLFRTSRTAISRVTTRLIPKAIPPMDDNPTVINSRICSKEDKNLPLTSQDSPALQAPHIASNERLRGEEVREVQAQPRSGAPPSEGLPRWRSEKALESSPHSDIGQKVWRKKSEQALGDIMCTGDEKGIQVQPSSCLGVHERLPRWRSEQVLDDPLRSDADLDVPRKRSEQVVEGIQVRPGAQERLPRWRNGQVSERPTLPDVGEKLRRKKIKRVLEDEEDEKGYRWPHSGAMEGLPRWRNEQVLEHIVPLKHRCEALYAEGRINDAVQSLIEITNTASEAVRADQVIADWLTQFTHRCVSALERIGNEASDVKNHDEAIAAYSTALSLSPLTPNTVLTKWARAVLILGSPNEALSAATKFKLPKFVVCRVICDTMEGDGRVVEAIAFLKQMESELAGDASLHDERAQWELGFRRRCTEKLADAAMDAQHYNAAADHFSTILSLNPVDRMDILIKRSKARVLMSSWEEALRDADDVIKLDPSCHRGYEMRHVVLHGAGRHAEAAEAFDTMLSELEKSPDLAIRQLRSRYVHARTAIRDIIKGAVRSTPRVLIDTITGRLYDKQQQEEAFKELPIYSELVWSMTTHLDRARISRAVKELYRYVMLSHRWEDGEPLLQNVVNISIYDLKASPTNIKLQRFCLLVRSLGFRWVWSDTSCVDKFNNVVLQESLVAMFTWYRGSSLTVVYLRDVSSESQLPGDLSRSIWNTRAWTYQEYVAAETIQFYTEDWKPYLGLTLSNHKKSPDIISEMQQATGVSAQAMVVLRPGLVRVREKLYMASRRETTLMEDIAYSLFGIFNAAIPVIYGEGDRAVGRLLEHILTGSGDVTILAWTGSAGSYNSCLPTDLTVFEPLVPPHVPRPIEKAEMDGIVRELRSCESLADLSLVTMLYDRLSELPSPSVAASRLKLPGIVFPLTELVHVSGSDSRTNLHVYRATSSFGDIEIKTADDLAGTESLCLVHPWIRPLLDQEFSHGAAALDKTTQALRVVARLRQPFGALLFEQVSRIEYRRVAADNLIMVQIREEVSLDELIGNIRAIEIQ